MFNTALFTTRYAVSPPAGVCKFLVADDTYFRPWESDFIVDAHTKLEVQINEQELPAKPTISVSVNTKKNITKVNEPKSKKFTITEAADEMYNILKKTGINKKNMTKNKKKMSKLFTEYYKIKKIGKKEQKDRILKMVAESIIRG